MDENDANCATQNEKAKSEIVAQIARIVRRAGLQAGSQGMRPATSEERATVASHPERQ
jgi:hypothetical protein